MDGCRNASGTTIENICSGYVVRFNIRDLCDLLYVKKKRWFTITIFNLATEDKMEVIVVMDTCGIKRRQNAYVRKLNIILNSYIQIINVLLNFYNVYFQYFMSLIYIADACVKDTIVKTV